MSKKKSCKIKFREYGRTVGGKCPMCGEEKLFFFDVYDAEACLGCDDWTEENCGGSNCPYCAQRPDFPSDAFYLLREKARKEEGYHRKDNLRDKYFRRNNGRIKHMPGGSG